MFRGYSLVDGSCGRWLSALSVDELTRIWLDALRKRYLDTCIVYIVGSSILGAGEGLLGFLELILRVVRLYGLACSVLSRVFRREE